MERETGVPEGDESAAAVALPSSSSNDAGDGEASGSAGGGKAAEGGAMKKAGWGFLRHPSAKDIQGRRSKARPATSPFDFLVVLDFEWTCDKPYFPFPPEIIEFPAVLLRATCPFQVVGEFQEYVRPQDCPTLTSFCTQLTGISQATVDKGVPLKTAVERFHAWLLSHGLLVPSATSPWLTDDVASTVVGRGRPHPTCAPSGASFAVVTWGDSDLMSTLRRQLQRLRLPVPPYFRQWINLKALFRSHYKRDPTGGLQRVVESCGLEFEGRAHSGLVDSRNTAKIVQQMASQGFRFTRTTRGLDAQGNAFGEKKRKRGTSG